MSKLLRQIQQTLKTTYTRLGKIPFIFILLAIEIYFFVNGAAHFPNWDASYGQLIIAYIIMTLIFLGFAKTRTTTEIRQPLSISAFTFVVFFLITWILLTVLIESNFLQPGSIDPSLFWPMIMLQICVVATSEELMFRGVLLSYLGIFISAIVFAVWHSWAYQIIWYNLSWETFNWSALLIAFIMGIILGFIAKDKRFGLPACIGVHACFNLIIMGILTVGLKVLL